MGQWAKIDKAARRGKSEEFEPDNGMLRDYQHLRGWAIIELRRIRAGIE
jgi:hypothetical protein